VPFLHQLGGVLDYLSISSSDSSQIHETW